MEVLTKPLAIIFWQSCLNRSVPVDSKLANVTPINKKGWKEDLGSCRCISPTLVLRMVTEHLECHHTAHKGQPGYQAQSARVCERQVLPDFPSLLLWQSDTLSGWRKEWCFGYHFPQYSSGETGFLWFGQLRCPEVQAQRVMVNGVTSSWWSMVNGTWASPELSIEASPVWCLYGQSGQGIKCILSQFADEVSLSRSVGSLPYSWRVGRDPDMLDQWVEASCRRFNKYKYQVLYLGLKSLMCHHGLGIEWLESCQLVKDLGVLVNRG